MVSISDLVDDRREISVPFAESSIKVVYRPSAYTAELESKSREWWKTESGLHNQWVFMLEKLLIEWDLKMSAKDKEPIPITYEGLSKVPGVILKPIYDAVFGDYYPNLIAAPSSSSTS